MNPYKDDDYNGKENLTQQLYFKPKLSILVNMFGSVDLPKSIFFVRE